MTTRGDEWGALLHPNLLERAPISRGVRLVLRASPEAVEKLHRLIALENACCAWINWSVEEADRLRVEATSDQKQGAELLQSWFLGSSTAI